MPESVDVLVREVIAEANRTTEALREIRLMLGDGPNTPKGAPVVPARPRLRLVSSDRKAA